MSNEKDPIAELVRAAIDPVPEFPALSEEHERLCERLHREHDAAAATVALRNVMAWIRSCVLSGRPLEWERLIPAGFAASPIPSAAAVDVSAVGVYVETEDLLLTVREEADGGFFVGIDAFDGGPRTLIAPGAGDSHATRVTREQLLSAHPEDWTIAAPEAP